MKIKNVIAVFILISSFTLFAGVPIPQTHNPSIPYFMEQTNFQTILLSVYGKNISGIIPDKYSDLNWNPAFILNGNENGAYLDFNYQTSSDYARTGYYQSSSSDMVHPSWFDNTDITPLKINPLFNFALIQKINDKITIGIINRSLFDYGPFRSSSYRYNYYNRTLSSEYNSKAYSDLSLGTVEVDENQQSVWGTQTEFTLGYNFSPKLDLGLKFGHYIFRQSGNLNDSQYSKYPHSLIDEYNNENLETKGNQYEAGVGIIYHINERTELGIYASLMSGNSSEDNNAGDNSHSWSERDTDTNYYSIRKYNLASNSSFSSDGNSPFLTLTFQKELSKNMLVRSFFSYRQVKKEITGSTVGTATQFSDYTSDSYDNYNSYFTRYKTSGNTESFLEGSGNETLANFKWFTSLIYKTESKWSAFASVILQMQTKDMDLFEKSNYKNNNNFERLYYEAKTGEQYNANVKNYQYNYNYKKWSAIIPVGIKAHVYGGFSFLIGTDLQFNLIEIKESGDLFYPSRIRRVIDDGVIVVEDIETNRQENYDSTEPMNFSKLSTIHFGAFYEHSSGLKLFVKTEGDIFNKGFWTFGLEYAY